MKNIQEIRKDDDLYLNGTENFFIRWYSYLNGGLNVLNQFRNLLLGIFALYAFMELKNILWLPVMLIPCIPVLAILGWYQTHRMAKVLEWLGMRFSTHYALKQFDYNEGQYEMLKEILAHMKEEKAYREKLHKMMRIEHVDCCPELYEKSK